MTSQKLRDRFLKYFTKHGHKVLPSSSLLPDNDASVLLTTAGMQQFKPYFLGEKDPVKDFGSKRTATVQKSFRTSDIDEVGDTQHLTFFQMLGNFSFGDYWKADVIAWAWEYLTKQVKLDKDRLWASIFAGEDGVPGDDEAKTEWLKILPAEKIVALGKEHNFWGPPGKTGSCGPSSEIYWQIDPKVSGTPATKPENFVEIWNLVFTEYFKDEHGKLKALPKKNIDTGMGLERLAMASQNKLHVFDTDAYLPIIKATDKLADFGQQEPNADARRARIIADHIRAAVFLLADGVRFSNKDQGYILRRIVRRAADQFLVMEFTFDPVVDEVVKQYGDFYPELKTNFAHIKELLNNELDQYRKVLNLDVHALVAKMRKGNEKKSEERGEKTSDEQVPTPTGPSHTLLTPDEAFTLYSTHGISLDRLERLGFQFERTGVEERVKKHQELSRAGVEKKFGGHGLAGEGFDASQYSADEIAVMTRLHSATHLLQASLRQILGNDVKQAGSDISPDRFRFDFTFSRKLTDEEKKKVEDLVNEKIKADLPVSFKMMPYKEAIKSGALAFFKQKYPEEVKVYSMGDFSKELCGGPHVEHTALVGNFKILSEQSVGSGLRRIKASVS